MIKTRANTPPKEVVFALVLIRDKFWHFSSGELKLGNVKKHAAKLEMLTESSTKAVPSLDGAKIVIETFHFSTKQEGIISVDGEWAFDLKPATVETQVFVAENEVAGLELQQATLTNGSMHISLKINRNIEDENYIMETSLLTESNEAFYANAANVERTNENTTINLVFPYSIWKEQNTLLLSVNGYEKLRLMQKKQTNISYNSINFIMRISINKYEH